MREASESVVSALVGWPASPRSMWDWDRWLPLKRDRAVSLGEGMTPLVPSRLGLGPALFWKNEGLNPTGSQKDRAMSLALSHAAATGAPAVAIASTGSAGLSCAAYAARAGLPCVVLVPRGTPQERLRPMRFHGARVIAVDGTFEELEAVMARLDPARWYQATTTASINAVQAEAPMTIAFEIVEQLGAVPDHVVVPIGGGATIAGVWRGFEVMREEGRTDRLPRLVGIQPIAFPAVHEAHRRGLPRVADAAAPPPDGVDTVLRNLKHVVPPDGDLALAAIRASGGVTVVVSDDAARAGQARLAAEDGIFCEVSAAVVVDAVAQAGLSGTVVGVVTGSGLREMGALPEADIPTVRPEDCIAAMGSMLG